MKETVLLTWQAVPDEISGVRDACGLGVTVVAPPARAGVNREGADINDLLALSGTATALLGWSAPREVVAAAPRLRFIGYFHHGIDDLPLDLIRERGIAVANAGGAYAVAIAEEAMAFLLACARRVVPNHRALTEARWQALFDPTSVSTELDGKTVVIVGFGKIGQLIGVRCKAFGMRVIAVRRERLELEGVADRVCSLGQLPTVLPEATFVVLALPLTTGTRGLFGESMFGHMRPGAYLINVARAHLVDEFALSGALADGRLAGYASDVWWDHDDMWPKDQHYPVPSRLEVHRMDCVVGNGDRGANTREARERILALGARAVAQFLRGDRPESLVDVNAGY